MNGIAATRTFDNSTRKAIDLENRYRSFVRENNTRAKIHAALGLRKRRSKKAYREPPHPLAVRVPRLDGLASGNDGGLLMTFEEFLARLSGCRAAGSRRTAKCPAHDDRNPSLSICLGDDGHKLVKCHAGCRTEDVLAAMGLPMSARAPEAMSV